MTLKVGDRVIGSNKYAPYFNIKGTIFEVRNTSYGVEFDTDIGGHDGDGRRRMGYAWYCWKTNVKLYETKKKEIKLNGIAKWCKEYYK